MLGKLRYELIRLPDRRSTFEADVLEHDEQHMVLAHRVYPSRPFLYRGEEALGTDYLIVWFLFKDQPFDVGRFYRPDGTWTGYYADVLEPVRWQGDDPHTLEPIVDLFLDLWIAPDGSWEILDEDELEDAIRRSVVTADQERHARATLEGLVQNAAQGLFPPEPVKRFTLQVSQLGG